MGEKSLKVNMVLNIVRTCASIVFPVFTFPYVSRVLLPENVGRVSFAQAFVNYFALIAALGISTYAIRTCAAVKKNREQLQEAASQLFSINIITTLVSYIALIFTLVLFRSLYPYRVLIIIESTTIVFATVGADWLNQAMEDFYYITVRTLFFQLVSLILIFVFVKTQEDYLNYALICVLSAVGTNILNIFYRKRYCNIRLTLDINWKLHFAPIVFLFVMMLAQTIFNNADITMLGLMRNDFDVGIYSTANKINRIISQVVQSLCFVVIPRLSIYFSQNDFSGANKLLRKVLGFNLSLGLPMVVGVLMLSKELVLIVGGDEYITASPVLKILILGFMFSLVGGSFLGNAILIPMGKERYYMIVCCIAAGINVILNVILIPSLGPIGAATSTAFNGLVILCLLSLKVDKRIKFPHIWELAKAPIIGCVGITLCCYSLSFIENLYLRTATSVCLSVFVYILISIFLRNEFVLEIINSLGSKIKRK